MLDESICHSRGVRSILSLLYSLFDDLDLDLHCLPLIFLRVSRYELVMSRFNYINKILGFGWLFWV